MKPAHVSIQCLLWVCTLVTAPALALAAEPDFAVPGFFAEFSAGIFCEREPDSYQAAPLTRRGSIDVMDTPFSFVRTGPRVPALPGYAFGIVTQPLIPNRSRVYTVRLHRSNRASTDDEFWETGISESGLLWAGYTFDAKDRPPLGRWSLSLLQDDYVLLTQYFEIVAPQTAPDLTGFCTGLFS